MSKFATPRTFSQVRNFIEVPDGTLYRYNGLPYGGLVDGVSDFHGTFCSPQTDVGPRPRTMSAFFEHGMFPPIGFKEIGTARIMDEESEDGRLFEILVKRSNEYHDLIARLYNEGILYGSAQALETGYRIDERTGEMLRFIPGEWSFTVSPSNILARPLADSTLRSIFQDFIPVQNEDLVRYFIMNPSSTTVVEPITTVATSPEAPQELTTPQVTLNERVRSVVMEGLAEVDAIQNDPNAALVAIVQQLAQTVTQIAHSQEQVVAEQAAAKATNESVARSLGEVQESVLTLAETLTARLKDVMVRSTQMAILETSEAEKEILARRMSNPSRASVQTAPAAPTVGFVQPGLK